ncbi:hypothetical protein K8Q94_02470 [Candidatus Nomurabacteria bacterium]|nr:hypothetical protein [Candidatus Nomurabacteria bacterium]
MKNVILLNKKEGQTPLEALEQFRAKNKEYKDMPMTYAGRLDPMASGLLIVLVGKECKQKEKYLNLDKEYEFEILFGFATDTYDILGKLQKIFRQDLKSENLEKNIKENLKYFTGKFTQKYPMYSSKTVKGKPLFAYAREGEEVETPTREVFVKSLKFIKIKKIGREKLLENIEKRIAKVNGDFRQKEILKIWKRELGGLGRKKLPEQFFSASFKIKCGSGTYVRGIAHSLGEKINIPALAYSIKRTKIGKYSKL